jgi:hypothetical protein
LDSADYFDDFPLEGKICLTTGNDASDDDEETEVDFIEAALEISLSLKKVKLTLSASFKLRRFLKDDDNHICKCKDEDCKEGPFVGRTEFKFTGMGGAPLGPVKVEIDGELKLAMTDCYKWNGWDMIEKFDPVDAIAKTIKNVDNWPFKGLSGISPSEKRAMNWNNAKNWDPNVKKNALAKCETLHKSPSVLWAEYVAHMTTGDGKGYYLDGNPITEPGFELDCDRFPAGIRSEYREVLSTEDHNRQEMGKCIPHIKWSQGPFQGDPYGKSGEDAAGKSGWERYAFWYDELAKGAARGDTGNRDFAAMEFTSMTHDICFTCGADPYDQTQFQWLPIPRMDGFSEGNDIMMFKRMTGLEEGEGMQQFWEQESSSEQTLSPQFLEGFKKKTIKRWCNYLGVPYGVPELLPGKTTDNSKFYNQEWKTASYPDVGPYRPTVSHFGSCYTVQKTGNKIDEAYLIKKNFKTGTLFGGWGYPDYDTAVGTLNTGMKNGFDRFLNSNEDEWKSCKLTAEGPDSKVTVSGALTVKLGQWACYAQWGFAMGAEIYAQTKLEVGYANGCASVGAAGMLRAAAYLRGPSSLWHIFGGSCECDDDTGRFDDDSKDEATCADLLVIEIEIKYGFTVSDICEGAEADMHTEISATFEVTAFGHTFKAETPVWSPIDKDSNGKNMFPSMGQAMSPDTVVLN